MSSSFLTFIASTCIVAIVAIFAGGQLVADGNYWGLMLLAFGSGWLGIVNAALIRAARRDD